MIYIAHNSLGNPFQVCSSNLSLVPGAFRGAIGLTQSHTAIVFNIQMLHGIFSIICLTISA